MIGPRQEGVHADHYLVGVLCAMMVVVLFSGFTLVSRLGLSSTLAVPDLAALRFGVGGTLLLPVLLRYGLYGVTWYEAAALSVLGGLGFAYAAYAGFALAPAAHGAVLLHGTLPLTTAGILALCYGLRADAWYRLGLTLVAVGVAIIVWDTFSFAGYRQLMGDACLLIASAFWSGYGVLVRRLRLPALHAASLVAVLSMAIFLPLYAVGSSKMVFAARWDELLLQGVFQGVLIGVVSIVIYTRAVSELGADTTALFSAAVPTVTTLGGALLLSERPSLAATTGVAIVTAGMLVALGSSALLRTGQRDATGDQPRV